MPDTIMTQMQVLDLMNFLHLCYMGYASLLERYQGYFV